MKKDFILPILVLSLICLFVSGALAVVNNFTAPVIEASAAERAAAARKEIIPQADGFELLNIEDLPRTITDVYRATNNTGYIFMITVPGYGGNISMICGINNEGKVIKTAVLSHTETKGMTDPVFAPADSNPANPNHQGRYTGKDKNLDGVIAVTGATISSNAYKSGVRDAFEAFELARRQ
ncbi:MAG: FMN-binding protein [Treponema sp.]|nr:FMN-binding protein [Treponema sp.]